MTQGVSRPKSTRRWPFCSYPATSNWGPKPRKRTVWGRRRQGLSGSAGVGSSKSGSGSGDSASAEGVLKRPWGSGVFGGPELPAHLELVGHVVVELLGGFADGVLDGGVGFVGWGCDFGWLGGGAGGGIDVDALVGGRLR